MKPSKKKSKKKKKPSPAATEGPAPTPPEAAAGADDPSSGASCSPRSETLTLAAAAAAAAAAASETESSGSSSGQASAYTSAFTSSSSGGASTSSSASTASSSATGDERRDLAWLFDAFGSATIDQVDSAYREAGGDPFLAAGILGSTQDPQPPDLSPRAVSGGRKAARRPKRVAVAVTGMVADVIGKGYTRPATSPVSATNSWKGRLSVSNAWKGRDGERDGGCGDRKCNVEEAEQFLCSMLGDNSELSMGVVRDVLGSDDGFMLKSFGKVISDDWLFS